MVMWLLLQFSVEWSAVYTFSLSAAVSSICWKQDGSCLLTGGTSIALWEYTPGEAGSVGDPEEEGGGEGKSGEDEEDSGRECVLKEIWRSEVPSPVTHLAFSPNGRFFATCGDVSVRPLPIYSASSLLCHFVWTRPENVYF